MRPIYLPSTRLIAILALLAVPAALSANVKLNKAPVKLERKTFDPKSPPKDLPKLQEGEDGLCMSVYSVSCTANMAIDNIREADGTTTANVRILGITVNVGMSITIWLPNDAHRSLKVHEEGHRELYEKLYKQIDPIAKAVAGKVVGKSVTVPKASTQQIIFKAVQRELLDPMVQECLDEVRAPSKRANAIYDEITDHNRNRDVRVEDAIKQALERMRKERENK